VIACLEFFVPASAVELIVIIGIVQDKRIHIA